TPGSLGIRLPEKTDVIIHRVAPRILILLFKKHLLQAHDLERLTVALMAETGDEQTVGKMLLRRREIFQRQALPFARDVMPVEALLRFPFEARFFLLRVVE